jgi:hypothetical protein
LLSCSQRLKLSNLFFTNNDIEKISVDCVIVLATDLLVKISLQFWVFVIKWFEAFCMIQMFQAWNCRTSVDHVQVWGIWSEELCSAQLWRFLWSLVLHIRSNFCGTNFLYWSQGLKMPPSSANISNSAANLENFGKFMGDAVWIWKWLAWGPSVVFDTEIDPDDMGYNAVLQHQWVILSSNWSPPLTFGLMNYSELQYLWNLTFQSWLVMCTSSVYPHGVFSLAMLLHL